MRRLHPCNSRFLLIALFLAVSALFVAFACTVFPLPSSDSHDFLPAAVSWRAGHGLRNPLSGLRNLLDPSGGARYVQYPPLFPLTVGTLMPSVSARAAFLVLAGMNAVTLGLLLVLLWRSQSHAVARRPWSSLEITLAALGTATALVGFQLGRPEALAAPLTLVLWAGIARFSALQSAQWLLAGPLLGLLAASHPMAAVLLSILYCAFLSLHHPLLTGLAIAAKSVLTAVAVFAGVLAISPFGLTASLGGIWHHAQHALFWGANGSLAWYWISNPTASFYAFPYIAALILVVICLATGRLAPRSRALFILAACGCAALVWLSTIWSPQRSYNLVLLAPLVFWWNVDAAGRFASVPLRIAVAACSALASSGFARNALLLTFLLRGGVPMEEASSAYIDLAKTTAGPIALTYSLWVLSGDYDRMELVESAKGAMRSSVMIVQQNYGGLTAPPEIPGFVLREDKFVRDRCTLFGLRLAHTWPGYGFATYRRIGRAPREARGLGR